MLFFLLAFGNASKINSNILFSWFARNWIWWHSSQALRPTSEKMSGATCRASCHGAEPIVSNFFCIRFHELQPQNDLLVFVLPVFLLSNSLTGSFRKGSLQKNIPQISAKFLQLSRTLPWRNKSYFLQLSANFPQNFCKLSFANDPISELLFSFSVWAERYGHMSDWKRSRRDFSEAWGQC